MKINIVNSLHPQAIGDAISSFPMLWAQGRPARLSVYFSCTAVRPLCTFADITDQPVDGPVLDIQEFAYAAEGRGLHLAQSWFPRVGLEAPEPPFIWPQLPVQAAAGQFDVAIAPFSGSDEAGGKTWPAVNWREVLSKLHGRRICLLCAGTENTGALQEFATTVLAGRGLREVCGTLQNAALVLSVDNGIGWLAQALGRPHILLQSSRHFPSWSRNPNQNAVNLSVAASADAVLSAIEPLFAGKSVPAAQCIAFDRKIARLALLRAMRFAARGDSGSAAASYRIWCAHATPLQLALAGVESLAAAGRLAAALAGRAMRRGHAIIPRRRRQF